jgi:hypothetical protein
LRAANTTEDIKIGKWYNGKLLINKLTNKKYNKGYCQPPLKTLKISNNKKNEDVDKNEMILTLDNYKTGNCNINLTPSKGGYTRDQLYDFGVDYLKIPHTQLRKDNKIDGIKLQKDVLCKIINNKYREIQKSYGIGLGNDNIILNAYEKDIEQCVNGESKGGYSWTKLKDIAITYYGLTEDEIKEKDYKKEDLCKYISKIINKQEQNLGNLAHKTSLKNNSDNETSENEDSENINNSDNSDKNYNMKYNGDIKLCNETPKRGGLSLSKVKKIAEKNFNIDTHNKNKKELCSLIEAKLQKQIKPIRNIKTSKSQVNKYNDNNNNVEKLDEDDDEEEEEEEEEDNEEEDKEEEEKYKETKL